MQELNFTEITPITQKLLWFTFDQNNSGGHFVCDENVCETVCIQAKNAKEAIAVAERFMDNSDSCPCCGDRWSFWIDDSDGHTVPSLYGEPIETCEPTYFRKRAKLHFYDGTVMDVKVGESLPITLK